MSWECPHLDGEGETCDRLKGLCKPFSKGCLLYGKGQSMGTGREETTMNATAEKQKTGCRGKTIRPQQTLGELVTRYPRLRAHLEQLGIDYCCGGKRPLAEAVKAAGLELDATVADLEMNLTQDPAAAAATDWSAVTLSVLADHILDTHHVFTKTKLKRIDTLLEKVQNAHRARHGDLLGALRNAFDLLKADLEAHLMKEEQVLFPAIKGIDGFMAGRNVRPEVHCGSVAHPIRQMEHEHDAAGAVLARMRELAGNYRPPADACQTFQALYEALAALEADLHEHIHLENNILFPASMKQEASMGNVTYMHYVEGIHDAILSAGGHNHAGGGTAAVAHQEHKE